MNTDVRESLKIIWDNILKSEWSEFIQIKHPAGNRFETKYFQ